MYMYVCCSTGFRWSVLPINLTTVAKGNDLSIAKRMDYRNNVYLELEHIE